MMSGWENFRATRRELPKAGIGTFVMALVFMTIVGAVGGVFTLLFIIGRGGRYGARPSVVDVDYSSISLLFGCFALGGALIGFFSVFRFWPRPEEVAPVRSNKPARTPDERLTEALQALAAKLRAAGEMEWAEGFEAAVAAPTKHDVRSQADQLLRQLGESDLVLRVEMAEELRDALMRLSVSRNLA